MLIPNLPAQCCWENCICLDNVFSTLPCVNIIMSPCWFQICQHNAAEKTASALTMLFQHCHVLTLSCLNAGSKFASTMPLRKLHWTFTNNKLIACFEIHIDVSLFCISSSLSLVSYTIPCISPTQAFIFTSRLKRKRLSCNKLACGYELPRFQEFSNNTSIPSHRANVFLQLHNISLSVCKFSLVCRFLTLLQHPSVA